VSSQDVFLFVSCFTFKSKTICKIIINIINIEMNIDILFSPSENLKS